MPERGVMGETKNNNFYGFIYITTNLINGKKYIGQKKGYNDTYLGSGKILKLAIKKYGRENFKREILDYANSKEELNIKEDYYIHKYNAHHSDEFYNISSSYTPNVWEDKTEEEKQELIDLIRIAHSKGSYQTEEFRNKMSQVTSGERNGMYGKKHSKVSKQKMSENSKGLVNGERNGMFGKSGNNAINGVHVFMYEDKNKTKLIKEFVSVREFQKYFGITGHSGLDKAVKDNKVYRGYYWDKKRCNDYSERK